MLLAGGFLRGEHHALQFSQVLPESLVGLLFLIFFGSLTAFSAYAWLLKHYPPTLVATHTYVNPIVAVLLGWALAGERITGSILFSMALAILAISLVNRGARDHRISRGRAFTVGQGGRDASVPRDRPA
jgi:drug/metabolite transporter (DMT)-like permease